MKTTIEWILPILSGPCQPRIIVQFLKGSEDKYQRLKLINCSPIYVGEGLDPGIIPYRKIN
jgi:hypothetical protein